MRFDLTRNTINYRGIVLFEESKVLIDRRIPICLNERKIYYISDASF